MKHCRVFSSCVRALSFSLPLSLLLYIAGCGGSGSIGSSGNATPQQVSISAISPKEVPVGSSAVTVTVSGAGFTSDSVLLLNGNVEPTVYVSSTQLQATVPATQLQTGQVLAVAVRIGQATTNANTGIGLQVDNPIPTISAVSPAAALLGTGGATVTIAGTNFVSGVIVTVNGNPRTTNFVSDTQLTAALPATDFAQAGSLLLNVTNPQPGGGASGTAAFTVNNLLPTVSSLSPSAVQAGGAGATITLTGSGFVPATGVLVNGASRPVVYGSATTLTITISQADQNAAGVLAITAVNPAPGGGVSGSAALAVNNPVPGAIKISPSTLLAGPSGPTLLTVTGTGFVPSTVVQIGGSPRQTTYVSATELIATVSASDQATAVALAVTVFNSAPGGGTSTPASLTVTNPAPGSINVTPNVVGTGTATPTPITVTGANFVPSTVAEVNGSARPTTFVSSTQLLFTLTVADQAAGGSLSINAFTPVPGGGMSTGASIAVNNPTLGNLTLAPGAVPSGLGSDSVVAVTGSGFIPGTSIQVNGSPRSTTYLSPTQLTFVLLAADVATAGKLSVAAANPAPVSNTSPVATLTVSTPTPTPTVAVLFPSSFVVGSPASSLTVNGTGFNVSSVVQWNGTALSTNYLNSANLGASVPANLLANTGIAAITVNSPTALSSLSNALNISIVNPPAPTLTVVSPTALPINTAATVTLTGTGFTAASTVALNGANIPATYVSSTVLTVALPASTFPLPGNESFTVTTPAPGGGTTTALTLTAYIGIVNNNMIYNPVNGLFYVSVPSSAGAPYGNSVVSVDPATGTIGTPIFVGSEPNKLALTSDGRYLWVGLDGAGSVRKVDLSTGTPGLQFTLGGNGGIYDNPYLASALAALPGATDSVVVSLNSGFGTGLNIYDNGVARAPQPNGYYSAPSALLVDGARSEIYAGLSGSYMVYTYSANSLTLKTTVNSGSYASSTADEMQITGGRLYTDFGTVYDPESGSLLGTLYNTGSTAASGPTVADATLGKAFVLDYSSGTTYSGTYNQIQVFDTSTFNHFGSSVIPLGTPGTSSYPSRLTRWGSNGLAFRTSGGIYSLRSNLVKDLSTVSANLGVTLTSSGATATGANTTYTAVVTNVGPSAATNVTLTPMLPSTAVLVSGSTPCAAAGTQSCSLGTLTSGASVLVTYIATQNTAGNVTFTVQVAGSENDPVQTNNQASNSTIVTGSTFALAPSIVSLSPSTVQVGAPDTAVTITGSNFVLGSTVLWSGTALSTTYVSAGRLTATIPSANLAAMGWGAITVSTPAPGGGVSGPIPLTVFQVLTVGVSHILYDQYDRKLYASVSSGSTNVTGNSIAAITPETGTIGTPVQIGSQPTKMAMSDDGNILYTILGGASSVARFNLLTQQADFSASLSNPNTSYSGSSTAGFRDLAVLPGSEDTIALDFGYTGGLALVDFTPSSKTATLRGGTGTGIYTGSSPQFLDAKNLLIFNVDTWRTLDKYSITSAGFSYNPPHSESTLYNFSTFKLRNKIAYADAGGVADPTPTVAIQLGKYGPANSYSSGQLVEPDVSLSRIFFLAASPSTGYYGSPDTILAYDKNSYLPLNSITLPFATIEGNTTYTGVDLVRWGQDGLAALTSGGHIYLLRGPVVVPQELNNNTAAVITASSASTLAHGAGNTTLTLTGSNFIPGVAVTWNGSYRTTTIVDATHVTVAIPAADLTAAGTVSLVATNPGASASSPLTVTIN